MSIVLNLDTIYYSNEKPVVKAESLSIVIPTYLPHFNYDDNTKLNDLNITSNLDESIPVLNSKYIFETKNEESRLEFCVPFFDTYCSINERSLEAKLNGIKLRPEFYFSDNFFTPFAQLSYEQVINNQIYTLEDIDTNRICYAYTFSSDETGLIQFTIPQEVSILESFNNYSTTIERGYIIQVMSTQEFFVFDGDINIISNSNVKIEKRQISIVDFFNELLDFYSLMYNYEDFNFAVAKNYLHYKINKYLDQKHGDLQSLYTAPDENKFIYLKYSTVLPAGKSELELNQLFYSSYDHGVTPSVQNFYLMTNLNNLNVKLNFFTERFILRNNASNFKKQNNIATYEGLLSERFPINVCEDEYPKDNSIKSESQLPPWIIALWVIFGIEVVSLFVILILWIRDSLKRKKAN